MSTIGERILDLRKEQNLSQKELAKKIGITEASLSRYENNLREPKAEIIIRLSNALDCSTDYLLVQTDERYPTTKENMYLAYKPYYNFEDKVRESFLTENIISEDKIVSEYMLKKVLKYGVEAATEIIKLENKLQNQD